MKKNILLLSAIAISGLSIAQVGVNTPNPKSTFDITAKNPTGTARTAEGLLVPRVDRQRAQSMTGVETSTLIYINNVTTGTQSGAAAQIDSPGYYYFDGTFWTKMVTDPTLFADTSIYENNGTISSNRVVAQADKTLAFTSTATTGTSHFSVDGKTFSIDALNNRVGIGTIAPPSVLSVVNPTAGNTIDAFSAGINNCGTPCGQGTARNINLFNANGTNSQFASLDFIPAITADGISGASIKGIDRDRNNGYAGLQFYTRNASGYAPRMTMKSSGNIGIGTQTPTNLFHIESATSGAVKIVDGTQGENKVLTSDANGVATWQAIPIQNSPNIYNTNGTVIGNRIVTQGANTLAFTGTSANLFSVDGATFSVDAANNRIGVGTTTPTATVDIVGTTFGIKNSAGSGSWDNLWFNVNSYVPSINASGAENGLQFNVGTNATGTYGDGQTLKTVATMKANGSVGIGTTTPANSAILELSSTNQGFLPPRLTTAQRDALSPKPAGLMIYNVSTNCMDFWNSASWVSMCGSITPPQGNITAINCISVGNNGTLTNGISASGVTSIIPYSGGNGGTHVGQSVNSTGVTGLTATLTAGSFSNGTGSLTYVITGTPSGTGTANFAINIGGQSCILSRTVVAAAGSISSLNCAGASTTGALSAGTAVSGVVSTIAYTGGNGGSYTGQTILSTGVAGLTATLSAGNFANGNGTIIYTISGTPTGAGPANFTINIGGSTCTLSIPVEVTAYVCKGQQGIYIDPNNPQKYYRCILVNNKMETYKFTCPSGSLFDDTSKLCIIQ
ncbi:chitin binding peritrophin-A domain-containing protein [Chryseobacterium limigenitum]|uniref:Chitin binding Peritrophin-A domain-containing protein n=1 Tax=Chryseobacterium limigenitum TaxID=1612149 RepID=A0A1K2IWW5_9FLAO|nr:chitin binding peritrophin-A domain-containing protein [Chryseobacterium limigenitum]SFZ96688.1 Chitin binding Peritrophin-A domain-containing protein [Chryseobacterium limigenitum]